MFTLSRPTVTAQAPPATHRDEPFASYAALSGHLQAWGRAHRSGSAAAIWRRSVRSAVLARRAGAADALVTAALLHRLGDLVRATRARAAASPSAASIAHLGADLLADLYPPLVTEPIRLQPSAQRYLATVTLPALCRAARVELAEPVPAVKPMTKPERECFAALPFSMNAVKLCRWTVAVADEEGGEIDIGRELPALLRITERSVCNDGFGWGV